MPQAKTKQHEVEALQRMHRALLATTAVAVMNEFTGVKPHLDFGECQFRKATVAKM